MRRAPADGAPARRSRRRRLIGLAALALVALLAGGQVLRARYDVVGIVRARALDWASMHTDWLVASPEDVDRQIAAAKAAWPFGSDLRSGAATGPLRVLASNPRYFTDGSGRAIYLAGSHTWSDFQDNGHGDPPPAFDYERFLAFLVAHHHNLLRLWVWESSRWTLETPDDDYWFAPMGPFQRTGPGDALDGKPRWDLTRFDQAWFNRLRERVVAAGQRGIYVSVMLFNGWSVASRKGRLAKEAPWHGHPFNRANNVNGIDGDPNGDDSGTETQELGDTRLLEIQEAYVRKVINTLGDLDNVLWEVSNESHPESVAWQYHMIDFIKAYEAMRPKRHPVGMTATYPNGRDGDLLESHADWISPARYANPPASDGAKVIIADTDHIFGIGGDPQWVWKSFTRGLNVSFMDGYDGAGYGVGGQGFKLDDPRWVSLRRNIGYVRVLAERMDLPAMTPRPDLCSTSWCLANEADDGAEYVIYAPEGGALTVDLSAARGMLSASWFSPGTGTIVGDPVAGGQRRTFELPFRGDVVLQLASIPPTDG
jgi:hypothetical protein